jgi:hypothetical protein
VGAVRTPAATLREMAEKVDIASLKPAHTRALASQPNAEPIDLEKLASGLKAMPNEL